MPFLISQAIEVRPAKAEILPDERKRLTRFVSWKQNSELPLQLTYSYGDADVFSAPPTGWEGLRLIDAQSDYSLSNNGAGNDPIVRLTYEQISATGETQVGGTETTVLDDGRVSRTLTYIQFSNVSYTPTPAGTAGSGGFLIGETANDNGSVRTIRRTYVESGLLAQVDETKNNGKLLIRTLTYAITTPPTPSGYTLISENKRGPDGYEILTYTFAKGDGEISRRTGYNKSNDEGTTGVTTVDIAYLTAPSVATDPTTTPGIDFQKKYVDLQDRDGHRIWNVAYVRATGRISVSIRARHDGLREVTYVSYVSLGERVAPSGAVILDDEDLEDGYVKYVVTAMQTASGGNDPTAATITFERLVPFTYPGRAKAYNYTATDPNWEMYDVFRSPPATVDVLAEIQVTYQTNGALGSLSNHWNPKEWATIQAEWTTLGNMPGHTVQALPGYRSVSDSPLSFTASVIADEVGGTMMGNIVFGGTTAKVTVFGGPEDPGGNTYTLDATIEPAFTTASGTKYYRKTVVTATIPAQEALPV